MMKYGGSNREKNKRDPKRIKRIVKLLEKRWEAVPDWRLGQLLVNCTFAGEDLFYLEDDELEERLDTWLVINR